MRIHTIFSAIAMVALAAPVAQAADEVYELRTYTTHEGKLPALHKRFRDHTMKIFANHGMRNVIYTTPVEQPNTLTYLIAHDSREAADASWKAFREDPAWQKAYKASIQDGKLVKKVDRMFLTPTDYSPKTFFGKAAQRDRAKVYELRIYTTNDGKLSGLHDRFRDHTMTIFKNHGMENVFYSTPEGKDNLLVYLIAHDSREAAKASWKGFRNDPAWQKAYKASIQDGKLVKKVDKTFLQPTDYSPRN